MGDDNMNNENMNTNDQMEEEICVLDGVDTPFGKPEKEAPATSQKDPEDLDRTYYDPWEPVYDYDRPVKITDIQYHLQATAEEVESIAAEMKRTNSSAMVIVPFYEDGKLDPNCYEGLVVKEFCTRHLLDNDYQYGSEKWNYYDGVFRFAVFYSEMISIVRFFHYRLGTDVSDELAVEATAKHLWHEENASKFNTYDARHQAFTQWAEKWREEHRKGKAVLLPSPKVAGIRYCIDVSKDQIADIIEEMKRTRCRQLVIVPNTDGGLHLDDEACKFYYEGLLLKEYATDEILGNPYFENHNLSKDGRLWYIRIYYSDLVRYEFFKLLGLPYDVPEIVHQDIAKKDEELRKGK